MPHTLVHGDFVPKNVRVRNRYGRLQLLVFDWETAGIGPPAADIALLPGGDEFLHRYFDVVSEVWPCLDWADILRLRRIGHLFRLLHSVLWESCKFNHSWIVRPMRHMTGYERSLQQLIREGSSLYG